MRIGAGARWSSAIAAFDGKFVYAVKTTGVYCRPSCPSRLAKPANVAFYATGKDAEAAGFRACRRCRPNEAPTADRHVAAVARAVRRIETAEELPALAELARTAGMSPFHFHRIFKSVTGVTPKAYAAAHRARKMREELGKPENSVTAAIYGAGFNSSSRFYATTNQVLGMTPSAFRKGGADTEIRFAVGECSLGSILVARAARASAPSCSATIRKGWCATSRTASRRPISSAATPVSRTWSPRWSASSRRRQSASTCRSTCAAPLSSGASGMALRDIPAGKTMSYADIAERIGSPKAVRAVAQACAANRIAVAIPCHRVVRRDGDLAGYRWGVERKRALLAKEKAA